METVKNTDLPDLLEHLGYLVVAKSAQLRFRLRRKLRSLPCLSSPHKAWRTALQESHWRQGSYYTTREMDSLMIKNRRTWKRYSSGKGGDAITFLQEFEGKGFREAVDYLLEFNGRARAPDECRRSRGPSRGGKAARVRPAPGQLRQP